MNILVTGARGMVGTALVANLYNIKENKNRTRPDIIIDNIYEYDIDNSYEELDEFLQMQISYLILQELTDQRKTLSL